MCCLIFWHEKIKYSKNGSHIIQPVLLAQELHCHLQLLQHKKSIISLWSYLVKMGRNQSRFKFVNTGLLSTVVHFQLKLVEIGQNIVNKTGENIVKKSQVHPLWDSAAVVQVHLFERLCKVLVSYHLNISSLSLLSSNHTVEEIYIFIFFVLGPPSILTSVHQNLEGKRNFLIINFSLI